MLLLRIGKLLRKMLLFVLVFFLIPITFIMADTIDYSRVGSININSTYKDIKFSNVNIKLYKIASINNNGDYVFDTIFQEKEKDIKNMSSSSLGDYALELNRYILSKNINSTFNKLSDINGVVRFDNLELGLYLIVSDEIINDGNKYIVSPFIVEVPSIDESTKNYIYNINIFDKVEIVADNSSGNDINTTSSNNDSSNTNTIGADNSKKNNNNSIISLPITSDNIIKYFIGLLLSVIGIIAIVIYLKSRKKEKNEKNI